jgi:hypothetical protein
MRRWQRIFTAFRVAILFLILGGIGVVLYLHFIGVPFFIQNWLKRELAKKDIEAHWSNLRVELLEGLVATNASLYELRAPHRKLAEAEEVAIHIRPLQLARGAAAVSGITVSHARLQLPVPQRLTAEDATARIRMPEPGVLEVQELSGLYAGIRLNVSGVLRWTVTDKTGAAPRPTPLGPADYRGASMFRKLSDTLESLHFDPDAPPEIFVHFDIDVAHWREAQLEVRATARGVAYTAPDGSTLELDELETQFTINEEALRVNKFRCRLYGGEIAAFRPCLYDLGLGQVSAALRSTTNVQKLTPILPPSARRALAQLEFTSNPRIALELEFSERTGTRPAVRNGYIEASHFKFRTIPVDFFRAKWGLENGHFFVTNAEIVKPDGTVTGSYRVNMDTAQYEARLDGALLPVTIFPLLNPKQREFLSRFLFDEPVGFADFSIRGNWLYPHETEIGGRLAVGRWRIQGLASENLTADVQWQRETLRFSNLAIQRQEGKLTGGFFIDSRTGAFEAETESSIFLHEILAAFWPQLKPGLDPYHFEDPPRLSLHARGNARALDTLELTGRGVFGRVTAREVPFQKGAAQWRYEHGIVHVEDFEVARAEGRALGALTWDWEKKELHGELVSTVQVQEVAPVFGPVAVKAMEPYRFRSAPLFSAYGTISFSDQTRTNVNVHIEGNDFVLTVPRRPERRPGEKIAVVEDPPAPEAVGTLTPPPIRLEATVISGDLLVKNRSLRLTDLAATMYGGTLTGWGEFFFDKKSVPYRSEFRVEKTSLADVVRGFWGKEGKISGLLSGRAKLDEGVFGDLNTLKGTAQAEITDGHLIDVPIFGLASLVLNMLPGTPGSERAKNAAATFEASGGRIRTNDLVVETATTRTSMKGFLTMDGEVDFNVTTRGKGIGALIDPLRWLTDVHITGRLEKPDVKPMRLP